MLPTTELEFELLAAAAIGCWMLRSLLGLRAFVVALAVHIVLIASGLGTSH
jgi:hypothetical protein